MTNTPPPADRRFTVRSDEVEAYSPANHTGTTNRRLIGRDTVRAQNLEVIRGTITTGSGALPHRHPGIEQVCYVLAGTARATLDDRSEDLSAGDCCYFPAGAEHTFTAISDEPVELLVIYAPPYAEQPSTPESAKP